MIGPTRQEINNAYEALESLKNMALIAADYNGELDTCLDWKKQILIALPPKPQPTMAEIEWDNDKHYLAEAETEIGVKVIMLWETTPGFINIIENGTVGPVKSEILTPTGKRYTLAEI